MWPFKRRPVLTMEELAAQQPPAPCGQQTTHWQWELVDGMPCPVCVANRRHAEKQAEQKNLAKMIADEVVRQLSDHPSATNH